MRLGANSRGKQNPNRRIFSFFLSLSLRAKLTLRALLGSGASPEAPLSQSAAAIQAWCGFTSLSPAFCFLLTLLFPSFLLLYNRIAAVQSWKLGFILKETETYGGGFSSVSVKEISPRVLKSVGKC